MATTHRTKVLIIGSGPAGYSAAIYAARANLEPIMVQGLEPGGQLTITTDVENYPGFADVIQGPWLMEQMAGQAQAVGTRLIHDMVVAVDLGTRPFVCTGDSGDVYIGETVIICTGAQAKWLGLESEQRFMGFGVSACATCDGFFFRGKEVAVIGGGNTAVEEALYLTNHASKVTLVHRRDALRAEKILQDRLFRNDKIESPVGPCAGRDRGRERAAFGDGDRGAPRQDRGGAGGFRSRACSSPSGTAPTRSSSPASSPWTRRATSRRWRTARRRTYRAYSPPATCRTRCSARP